MFGRVLQVGDGTVERESVVPHDLGVAPGGGQRCQVLGSGKLEVGAGDPVVVSRNAPLGAAKVETELDQAQRAENLWLKPAWPLK